MRLMAIYEQAAFDLLKVVQNPNEGDEFHFLDERGYVFKYRRDYQGLMARINPLYIRNARVKQGYFDILGSMNNERLTHDQLFGMLHETCTYEECLSVWRGELPRATGRKRHALISLAMLMFEQEINFGNESFQRTSLFNPVFDNPYYSRPRDLLMGYIKYMFENGGPACLVQFQNQNGLLIPTKDWEVKRDYFHSLRNDGNAMALMVRQDVVEAFREIADNAPNNPNI